MNTSSTLFLVANTTLKSTGIGETPSVFPKAVPQTWPYLFNPHGFSIVLAVRDLCVNIERFLSVRTGCTMASKVHVLTAWSPNGGTTEK